MGFFRFRKSIKILPGLKVNLNKKGLSMTAGVRGMHVTVGKGRAHTTIGIPGTGLSYTQSLNVNERSGDTESECYTARRSPKVCPYCGHHMRKQWQFCPKCHGPLLLTPEQQEQLIQQQQAALQAQQVQEEEEYSNSTPVPSSQSTQGKGGCLTSCLMLVGLVALLCCL